MQRALNYATAIIAEGAITRSLASALTCFLLVACASPRSVPVVEIAATFDEREAQSALVDGGNTVKGNAFMRQRGGGVITCAGQDVQLIPATGYARERMRYLYGNDIGPASNPGVRVTFSPEVLAYLTMVRTARCDSTGNFIFDRVADGEFFVTTAVVWQVGYSTQGGNLMQRVTLRGGQVVSVILSA